MDTLPIEIVVSILSYLYPKDLKSICLSSKDLYSLYKDELIWKYLLYKFYNITSQNPINHSWFEEFHNTEKLYRLTPIQSTIISNIKKYFPLVFNNLCHFTTYTSSISQRSLDHVVIYLESLPQYVSKSYTCSDIYENGMDRYELVIGLIESSKLWGYTYVHLTTNTDVPKTTSLFHNFIDENQKNILEQTGSIFIQNSWCIRLHQYQLPVLDYLISLH